MKVRTIFVMTHDSIGLGEDGPTHQPVEQLAALRAIPHLAVYRPGDPVETAECWEVILDSPRQAALIALSRPADAAALRREAGNGNKSAKGGYVLLEAEGGERKLTIFGTGSELHLAVEAREMLQKEGVPTAVVSMPCRMIFEAQDAAYRRSVLGTSRARVAVEAAVEMGWDHDIFRAGGSVRRHARVRCFREDRRCLQEVRHQCRGGGAGGEGEPGGGGGPLRVGGVAAIRAWGLVDALLKEARTSFLKKRSKKLLSVWAGHFRTLGLQS